MTIPVYPTLSQDPDPDEGWVEGPSEDSTLRSRKLAGLVTTRARYSRVPRTWQIVYPMLPDEDKQVLEIFERDAVAFGALTFSWISFREAYGAPDWLALTVMAVGRIVKPVAATGRSYKCTIAGQTAAGEPAWPAGINATIADGAATWMENTYRVRFAPPIKYSHSGRLGLWRVEISLAEF